MIGLEALAMMLAKASNPIITVWPGLQFFVHGLCRCHEMLIWMGFVAESNPDGEAFGSGPQILQGKAQQ